MNVNQNTGDFAPCSWLLEVFLSIEAPPESFARERGLLVIAAKTKSTEVFFFFAGEGEKGRKGWVYSMGLGLVATKGLVFHYKN